MKVPHCLTRNFAKDENLTEAAQRIRPAALADVLGAPNYAEFDMTLESGPHLSTPFSINGDFSVPSAPQGMSSKFTGDQDSDCRHLRPSFFLASYAIGQTVVEVAASRYGKKAEGLFRQSSGQFYRGTC